MANRRGKGGSSDRFPLLGLQNHCGWWLQPWNQAMIASWQESDGKPRQCVEKQRHYSANKGLCSQGYSLPSESESEVTQSCPTLCNPVDCSPPSSSIHGFSRQEYWSGLPFPSLADLPDPGIEPRDQTQVPHIASRCFNLVRAGPYKEGRSPNNWCLQTVVLEKTPESPLDSKEIKQVIFKGDQLWIFTGRTEAEAAVFWSSDVNRWLIREVPDAGKDWKQKKKRASEDEMAVWHHQCHEHELEQTL